MDDAVEKLVIEFFRNLKCSIENKGDFYLINNVPKSFEDIRGFQGPYKITFLNGVEGAEYVLRGGPLITSINKYLDGATKTSILKIDFDINPLEEISKKISLKNCEIGKIFRKESNKFFSRFTFLTTFLYLNESEKVLNEIYVHEGKVVSGDLSGYKVIEGEKKDADLSHLEKDYLFARENLKQLLGPKTCEIGEDLGQRLELEIKRIKNHYDNLLGELGGDINSQLKRIKEAELQLRVSNEEEAVLIRTKLERLRKGLLKVGDDDAKSRILKEQEFTIKDAQHKHSLNIDNKLINTTIIYYPIYSFNLFLKSENAGRNLEVSYDPLTKTIDKFYCESCGSLLNEISICSSGHLACDKCLTKCFECSKIICDKCLKRSCSVCGRVLCKDCVKLCMGCGKYVCKTHLRQDCVTGEERCVNCLRACLRCHGLSEPKNFKVSIDGSKVCVKCIGEENRKRIMKDVFR